ncbi:MAG: flagellin [Syntrophales bacterium]
MRINTNTSALNTLRQLNISDSAMAKSMEKLSSGYRINRAKDDAAGLSIAQKLQVQVRSNNIASLNVSQANSLLQVAEGGADQIQNILMRLKELATQAASTNNANNLTDITQESTALLAEIDRIANSTTYMGTSLLTGYGVKCSTQSLSAVAAAYNFNVSGAAAHTFSVQYLTATGAIQFKDTTTNVTQAITYSSGGKTLDFSTFGIKFSLTKAATSVTALSVASALSGMQISTNSATFQIGDRNTANYQISFQIDDMQKAAISVASIALDSIANAQSSIAYIDNAIDAINTSRAKIGALQNRLEYTYANLQTAVENLSSAQSVIRDVDMAAEMTSFTKNQILVQAGTAMLSQANQAPQNVLALFGR